MAVLIDTTANPEAFGTLTYGVEGEEPGFSVDSDGNVTFTGEIDGGGP